MTTKEQERKALAQIKKIVDDLGENSYVGTALDGALSLAEENIDCDAAFSARYYQETLFETEKKLKATDEKVAELEKELAERKVAYEQAYESVCQRLLNDYDIKVLKEVVTEKTSTLQQEVDNAAARIVEAANDPESAAFKNAVSDHRIAQQELNRLTEVLKRVCEISNAGKETAV